MWSYCFKRGLKMLTTMKDYPKYGTHFLKNMWKEDINTELYRILDGVKKNRDNRDYDYEWHYWNGMATILGKVLDVEEEDY